MEEPEPVKQEIKAEPAPVRERKPDKPARPVQQKSAPKVESKRKKQAPKQSSDKPKEKPKTSTPQKQSAAALQFVSMSEVDGKAKAAADYVHNVLEEIGVTAEITVAFTENGILLRLTGEGLGVVIGRRGETLDALQYLAGLVANRLEGDYMRVTIDSGNYREKREHTLEQLAKKLSASAIRYGRPSTLEPMNPYERRIIHSTVSNIEDVSSSSVGEEPNRRVVITPDRLRPQQGNRSRGKGRPRRNDRRDGGENRRRPRPLNREKSGETVQPTPTNVDRAFAKELEQTPRPAPANSQPAEKPAPAPVRKEVRSEGDDLPLYGKIEL